MNKDNSQPPSGDAPDLREALKWIAAKADSFCADCDGNRVEEVCLGSVHLITDKAVAALAASAPSSPATPAPLEVEVLAPDPITAVASALYETDPPESWMRTGTDEYRKRAVAMLAIFERDARAYANREDKNG